MEQIVINRGRLLLLFVLILVLGLVGVGQSLFTSSEVVVVDRMETERQQVQQLRQQVVAQRHEIGELRERTQHTLDAMSTRLGGLQARILRLDALGSRLVDMADLKDFGFDLHSEPGLGGTGPTLEQYPMRSLDISDVIDQLQFRVEQRVEELEALEQLMMGRDLRQKHFPHGRPVEEGWISSLFGMRSDPFTGRLEHHGGIDFVGRDGSSIIAVAEGVVVWEGRRGPYGLMVEINHGNGYVTRYAHNRKNLVRTGDRVKKKQVIALMGSSGRSTGPHLHFEVLHNGKRINPDKFVQVTTP